MVIGLLSESVKERWFVLGSRLRGRIQERSDVLAEP